MYKLFLTLRYLRKRRIVYVAIAAVMLCVAMVLTVMSVMGGWLDMVKQHSRGLLGDVVVDNNTYSGFPLYEEFIAEIKNRPDIVQATPVIYSYGLLRFPQTGQNNYAQVVGIRLDEICRVNAFKSSLFYEKFYPGTTTLAEQRRPVMGIDLTDGPHRSKVNPDFNIPTFVLPEPYRNTLERKRAEYFRQVGTPLDDADSEDTELNALLRQEGMPIIPGVWAMDLPEQPEDADAAPVPPEPRLMDNPIPGLIIGRELIADRQSDGRYRRHYRYPKGAEVFVTLVPTSETGNIEQPVNQPFRYADDSRTGIYEIDSKSVYCDFDLLQTQLRMNAADRVDPRDPDKVIGRVPGRCSQIQIKIAPGFDAAKVAADLKHVYDAVADREASRDPVRIGPAEREMLDSIKVKTWEETQAHFTGPVEKEKMLVTILFAIISLVAVVLILCILYMIVLQKTRDIGILKAIGASSGGAAAIWVMYGLFVGIVGGMLGGILGTVFVMNINGVQDLLIKWFKFRVWDLKVYSFDTIPHEVNPTDAIIVVAIAIVASTLGSVAAAWRAGRMEPVESIRYE